MQMLLLLQSRLSGVTSDTSHELNSNNVYVLMHRVFITTSAEQNTRFF